MSRTDYKPASQARHQRRSAHLGLAASSSLALCLALAAGNLSAAPPSEIGSNGRQELPLGQASRTHLHGAKWLEGQILVRPVPGLSSERMGSILSRAGGRAEARIGSLDVWKVRVPPGAESSVVAALASNPNIEFAEKDLVVETAETIPNDPYWNDPYFWHLQHIDAPVAWDYARGAGITVGVCDTGVDSAHPDLAGKLVPGWNVASNTADTSPIAAHGTRVAGVIGAVSNNGQGIASAAWDAAIMPIRVTNRTDGAASLSAIAACVDWARQNGARIVNASYYGLWDSGAVTTAADRLRAAGGLLFVSAGNYGTDPGSAPNASMIVVASIDENDGKSSFSNHGAYVDLAAPGNRIWSTEPNPDRLYRLVSGTSFASPLAAGVAALLMSADHRLSPSQVEDLILQTAVPAGWGYDIGEGRIDAGAAMLSLVGTSPDTTPPSVVLTAPSAGAKVSGEVQVTANASDNIGVALVELHAAGQFVATDNDAPYAFVLDTTAYADGSLQIQVVAYDSNGNQAAAARTVTVDNRIADTTAPIVSIGSPAAGAEVSGSVTFTANASDNEAVASLQLYVAESLAAYCSATTCSTTLDTTRYPNGSLDLRAEARDPSGNAASDGRRVEVRNVVAAIDTTPPTVDFVGLRDGGTVPQGNVRVSVNAADDRGVTSLRLYIADVLVASSSNGSLSYQWQTRKLPVGSTQTLRAVASDAAGNSTERRIAVTITKK
ncbi:S8 family serine peptidase [Thiocapsa rosea]|uniref:Subtilisin family serine protease n=1 Tax=Thiocapsa rosea TaxID=69360 RepID=A0A495V8V2_9GAMM|nr:S8 family serine peptidase [Thiocapsa rosea]RKT45776.1 subtilisin family serine protease [Thiocapsa rosea]